MTEITGWKVCGKRIEIWLQDEGRIGQKEIEQYHAALGKTWNQTIEFT